MKELSDLTAPAIIEKKPVLEAEVQSRCVAWMRGRGYWARKFSSQSQRSVPDYLFSKGTLKFATEFKRLGGKPTEAQKDEMQLMRDAGWEVFWCDSVDMFKRGVYQIEATQPRICQC